MWENLKLIIFRLFGKKALLSNSEQTARETYSINYKDASDINITAIVSNKLATLTVEESEISVDGENARAELLDELISGIWKDYGYKAVAMAYGTGMVAIIPYSTNGKLYVNLIPQSDFAITGTQGDEIISITARCDVIKANNHKYERYADYSIENGVFVIRQKATCDGEPYDFTLVDSWAEILPEIRITGIERLPIGFIKCPTDNRKSNAVSGVPITYGCEKIIQRIKNTLNDIATEYENKRVFVGADSTLFDKDNHLPKDGLFKTFLGEARDGSSFWEVFDPAIRDSAYFNRLQSEYALLEKAIGVSRGILTESETRNATATEIKRANHDTYAVVDKMREQIVSCFTDLADALNALANYYSLSAMGDYEVGFDWSYSLIEDSTETFNQYIQGKNVGAVSTVEIRRFIFPDETSEQAEEAVANIKANEPSISDLLGMNNE